MEGGREGGREAGDGAVCGAGCARGAARGWSDKRRSVLQSSQYAACHHRHHRAAPRLGRAAVVCSNVCSKVCSNVPTCRRRRTAPADAEADERQLRELAACAELDGKLGGGAGDDPYAAVLKLAWGVLLSQYGPEHAAGGWGACVLTGCGWEMAGQRFKKSSWHCPNMLPACCAAAWRGMQWGMRKAARRSQVLHHAAAGLPSPSTRVAGKALQLVKAATEAGALGFLRAGVLDSVAMQVRPFLYPCKCFTPVCATTGKPAWLMRARRPWNSKKNAVRVRSPVSQPRGMTADNQSSNVGLCLYACLGQDDADHQRQLYASVVNQLLMAYLMSPAGK